MYMSNKIFEELLSNQLDNIDKHYKLDYDDMKRLSKYLYESPLKQAKCCFWKYSIIRKKLNNTKIYFYFNKKKVTVIRILYMNFIGPLKRNEYINYLCNNKDICVNTGHLKKRVYKEVKKANNIYKKKNKKASGFVDKITISFN